MKADLYQILHAGDQVPANCRHRQWLHLGQRFCLLGVVLAPLMLINDGQRRLCWEIDSDQHPLTPLALPEFGQHLLLPRAVRLGVLQIPTRLLIEVQYTGAGLPVWHQQQAG